MVVFYSKLYDMVFVHCWRKMTYYSCLRVRHQYYHFDSCFIGDCATLYISFFYILYTVCPLKKKDDIWDAIIYSIYKKKSPHQKKTERSCLFINVGRPILYICHLIITCCNRKREKKLLLKSKIIHKHEHHFLILHTILISFKA